MAYIYGRYQVWGGTWWNFDLMYYHPPLLNSACLHQGRSPCVPAERLPQELAVVLKMLIPNNHNNKCLTLSSQKRQWTLLKNYNLMDFFTQSEVADGTRSPLVWMMSTNAADSWLKNHRHVELLISLRSLFIPSSTWLCCCWGLGRRPTLRQGTTVGQQGPVLYMNYDLSQNLLSTRYVVFFWNHLDFLKSDK